MGFQLCALERVLGPALFSCRRLQSPHLQCGAHPGARCQPPPQAAPLPQPLTCSHLTFFIPSHPTVTTPPSPAPLCHLLVGKGRQGRRRDLACLPPPGCPCALLALWVFISDQMQSVGFCRRPPPSSRSGTTSLSPTEVFLKICSSLTKQL